MGAVVTTQCPGGSSLRPLNQGPQPQAPWRWRVLTGPVPGVTWAVVPAASPQTLALPEILRPPDNILSPDLFAT